MKAPALVFLGAALSAMWVLPSQSLADDQVACIQRNEAAVCTLTAAVLLTTSGGGGRGEMTVRNGPQKCTRPDGSEVACTAEAGTWHAGRMCYVRQQIPVLPFTHPAWGGRTDGVMMRCTSAGNVVSNYWEESVAAAAVIPDPGRLAQIAVEKMNLDAIQLGTFPLTTDEAPDHLGYVGWNVWLWVRDAGESTWGPITRSASEAGYTVTATANVADVVWDMGNGDTVTCGRGTPWPKALTRNEPSPDCGYVYARDGDYTITATTHWNVEWSGIGSSGTIELDLMRSGNVRIAEVQVVNVFPTNN